jgi:hypothetical protein
MNLKVNPRKKLSIKSSVMRFKYNNILWDSFGNGIKIEKIKTMLIIVFIILELLNFIFGIIKIVNREN